MAFDRQMRQKRLDVAAAAFFGMFPTGFVWLVPVAERNIWFDLFDIPPFGMNGFMAHPHPLTDKAAVSDVSVVARTANRSVRGAGYVSRVRPDL